MALQYGVLRARPDRFKREDNASTPHLQIRAVDTSGQPWRIAVNVQSDSGSEVAFWVVDPLAGHPLLTSLPATASGYSVVARNADHALDYVKAPCSRGRTVDRCRHPAARAATTCRICCPYISTSARLPAVRSTRSARSLIETCTCRSMPSSVTWTASTAFTTST